MVSIKYKVNYIVICITYMYVIHYYTCIILLILVCACVSQLPSERLSHISSPSSGWNGFGMAGFIQG